VILRKDVVILRDGARAVSLAEQLVAGGYRGMSKEHLIYGSVDEAVTQLLEYKELGVDDVIVRCMSIDQADALETLELCGEVRSALI
jgi:alkanesulfonate monooxygenase SsuD/methylene tetrahydromethanopterin reductase-like flavin-dependent oxidoreductase (luciferase family)